MTIGGEPGVSELYYDRELILKLWNEGKTHKEILELIKCSRVTLTYILDELQISATARRQRSNAYKAIAVQQYDLNNQLIQEFNSISEASKVTNIPTGNISKNCKGKLKTAGGYIWKYKA